MENLAEYREKVFDFLERMPVGSIYVIDKLCQPENKALFMDLICEYVEATKLAYSNGVEVTNDYTRLRKTDVSYLPKLY